MGLLGAVGRLLAFSSLFRSGLGARRFFGIARILRNPAVGYVAFMINMVLKNLTLFFDGADQRAAEYPWVLRQLALFPKGSLILDVGCSESIFSHVLVTRGFRVVGLDLRDYPFKSEQMSFIKRNLVDSGLPDRLFDGVIMISTVEHIGLSVYGQIVLDNSLDFAAIGEVFRMLKQGGILIVTTPFVGAGPDRIQSDERQYGSDGLERRFKDFEMLREDYFYPYRYHHVLRWVRLTKIQAVSTKYRERGMACLVLRKNHS